MMAGLEPGQPRGAVRKEIPLHTPGVEQTGKNAEESASASGESPGHSSIWDEFRVGFVRMLGAVHIGVGLMLGLAVLLGVPTIPGTSVIRGALRTGGAIAAAVPIAAWFQDPKEEVGQALENQRWMLAFADNDPTFHGVVTGALLTCGLLSLALGYGLRKGLPWARRAEIVFLLVTAPLLLLDGFAMLRLNMIPFERLAWSLIAVVIIYGIPLVALMGSRGMIGLFQESDSAEISPFRRRQGRARPSIQSSLLGLLLLLLALVSTPCILLLWIFGPCVVGTLFAAWVSRG